TSSPPSSGPSTPSTPQRDDGGVTAPTKLFIDGSWMEATSDTSLPVVNPSTGKPFAQMACASRADVDRAVAAARRALDGGPWAAMGGFQRRSLLLALVG